MGSRAGKPCSIMTFTIRGGKIIETYIIRDHERLSQLDLSALGGGARCRTVARATDSKSSLKSMVIALS
jgi:hypothetical protein